MSVFVLLVTGEVIVVALTEEGTAALIVGHNAVVFVLVQIHGAVILVLFLVVVIVPAFLAVHSRTSAERIPIGPVDLNAAAFGEIGL